MEKKNRNSIDSLQPLHNSQLFHWRVLDMKMVDSQQGA